MKTRCPCCGAENSLDALIAHDAARDALAAVLRLDAGLARAAMRYLSLFRPARTTLSFERVARLLSELLPDMEAQRITRNRTEYPAPREAWQWAMTRCVDARDAGKLKTPLTGHGYLYEILTGWQPPSSGASHHLLPKGEGTVATDTKLRTGVADLAAWAKGERHG